MRKSPTRASRVGLFLDLADKPAGSADPDDVLCLRALRLFDPIELDTLTLGQRPEAAALDRGVMDEAILRSVLRRDEAEALRVVKPLHGSRDTHTVLFWV